MQRTYPLPRSLPGWLSFLGVALLLALMAYALTTYALSREFGSDVAAYWGVAERIRAGEPLYVAGVANASDLYRYAPWFAYAWVPLTFLPREAVTDAWVALMLLAAAASTLPLLRHGLAGTAAFALFAPLQVQGAMFGNIQPLLVLMLLWGVERRSGPFWIAVGASLKAVPLLLALVYAGRGEWLKAAMAVLLTAVLVAPAFLVDLSGYSTQAGPGNMSLISVASVLYLVVAAALSGLAFVAARSRYRWVAGALAMIAVLPRFLTYEISFLLVGAAKRPPV
ncbi:MAG: glycosyltransferase 87 family protein, partial [Candidatus Limnocylindria bacterium]